MRSLFVFLAALAVLVGTCATAAAEQFYNLNFIVYDTSTNGAIPGASVQIDQDFGNGTFRSTDGGGFANFGVYAVVIGYSVSSGGYTMANGSVSVSDHTTLYIGMTPRPSGRYRFTGWTCEWVAENGPNECDPHTAPASGPPAPPNPQSTPEYVYPDSLSQSNEYIAGGYITSQGQTLPSCASFVRRGNLGWISIQTNPANGYIQIGTGMYNIIWNWGPWLETLYRNGVRFTTKFEWYPPHDSRGPGEFPAGSLVGVAMQHFFYVWMVTTVYHPEYGWRIVGLFKLAYSYGRLDCIKPY